MKIAILADPEIPIPPKFYGGIERIIDMLIKGLIERGHEVTLLANKSSSTVANLLSYPGVTSQSKVDTLKNIWLIANNVNEKKFDIVHSFGRLAYLSTLLPHSIPKIMSYQREPSLKGIRLAHNFAKKGTLMFTGCSDYIASQIRTVAPAICIHNGCPQDFYVPNFSFIANAPMVFLGRIEAIKGVHLAIEVAKKTNRKLIIAGNIPNNNESLSYFAEQIQPHIDGEHITYIGPVDDTEKNELLQQSYCFLMPILWNEPFGIVMAESMACGTPVIAFSRGSVPEVIHHGVDGFHSSNVDEMVYFVSKIEEIDRRTVRRSFENKFSDRVIIEHYLTLYSSMLQTS